MLRRRSSAFVGRSRTTVEAYRCDASWRNSLTILKSFREHITCGYAWILAPVCREDFTRGHLTALQVLALQTAHRRRFAFESFDYKSWRQTSNVSRTADLHTTISAARWARNQPSEKSMHVSHSSNGRSSDIRCFSRASPNQLCCPRSNTTGRRSLRIPGSLEVDLRMREAFAGPPLGSIDWG